MLSERLYMLYPPVFEEPPVVAFTSEERAAALYDIDSFNITPWRRGCGPRPCHATTPAVSVSIVKSEL